MQAINNAAAAVGVYCSEGIVIAGEKKVASSLLAPPKTSEKMYKLDDHVCCAVAGLTADANTLIRSARVYAQRHRYTYSEDIPVEQLVVSMCNYKQSYTQHGGLRPFGVSFLYAGWDRYHGFQLYLSDPSGNYGGWKATAIGQNNQVCGRAQPHRGG
jgi:20S proteasome subunit alpha 3